MPQVNLLPKCLFLEGVDCCFMTSNQRLTHKRRSKDLLKFYLPHAMHSTHAPTHPVPQQTLFDTDAHKFLIDSGTSTHIWNQRKDFITYKPLSKEDQKKEQVLGINGDMTKPLGVGTVHLSIEDDLNTWHTIELHDVMYMPHALIIILFPQVFFQQCQSKGDALASCSISATVITLEWLANSGTIVTKYTPLNRGNVGIAYTAPGFKNSHAFASLCGMPAYISDDDDDDTAAPKASEVPIITMLPSQAISPSPPQIKGVMTSDFTTNPHVIPVKPDKPLMQSDQALLMKFHEKLGHC